MKPLVCTTIFPELAPGFKTLVLGGDEQLATIEQNFREQKLEGAHLLLLTNDDLISLGIDTIPRRQRVAKAIADLSAAMRAWMLSSVSGSGASLPGGWFGSAADSFGGTVPAWRSEATPVGERERGVWAGDAPLGFGVGNDFPQVLQVVRH